MERGRDNMELVNVDKNNMDKVVNSISIFIKEADHPPEIDDKYFKLRVAKHLEQNDYTKVVLDNEGEVIGGISLYLDENVYNNSLDAHEAMWWTCSTVNKIRRVRVASTLLREACKWCHEKLVSKIYLKMEYESQATIKLLQKVGFFEESRVYSFNLGV